MQPDPLICTGCNGKGRLAPKSQSSNQFTVSTVNLLQIIAEFCGAMGIENKVKADTFNYVVIQYQGKGLHLAPEVRKCLVWVKDKGSKQITTSRLNNWFDIAYKQHKKNQRSAQERAQPKAEPIVPEPMDIEDDLKKEQTEKVERDPKLQAFLSNTSNKMSMPEVSYHDIQSLAS